MRERRNQVVFYPRYFACFDALAAALFAAVDPPKPGLLETYGIVGFSMVDTRARFMVHRPQRRGAAARQRVDAALGAHRRRDHGGSGAGARRRQQQRQGRAAAQT
jgi:hypothetical protein